MQLFAQSESGISLYNPFLSRV